MIPSIEHQLTNEDHQLIEANRLGTPLSVYKLKPGMVRLLFGASFFLFLLGISVAILVILIGFMGGHPEQPDGNLIFAMLIGLSGSGLLLGLFGLCVAVPQSRKRHLVVCEHGLFQVGSRGRSKQVEVIHWPEIRSVRKFISEYAILYREHEICSLDILYQNVGELAELVKQRSGLV